MRKLRHAPATLCRFTPSANPWNLQIANGTSPTISLVDFCPLPVSNASPRRMHLITVGGVKKQYGSKVLYEGVSFQINPGDRIGLVGPNGAGKTTLFRLILGEESPDAGSVSRAGRARVAYFSQTVMEMSGQSVLEEVKSGAREVLLLKEKIQKTEERLARLEEEPLSERDLEKMLFEYGEMQEAFDAQDGYSVENRAAEILTGLGIGPRDQQRLTDQFSGGWKMRIQLAKVLLQSPDVLLLDEPTNHLDLESIIWLEQWLASYKGAIVMTSHDRQFMNQLVNRIIEIAHGRAHYYTGNYDFYDRESRLRREQLLASQKRQQSMLAKEQEFIARFGARASHAAQVQSRVKKLDKVDWIEVPPEDSAMSFTWAEPPRGGDEVLKLDSVSKSWTREDGEQVLVFQGVSALVGRGERVAVVGVNGAGKSTLLKILAGQTQPTAGKRTLGASIQLAYFSQNSLDVLDPKKTVLQELEERLPLQNVGALRNLLGAFLFSGEDVEKKVSVLSGGEKSRLLLAVALSLAPNCLILDEPTNHLDIRSREVLLKALQEFPGTLVLVSHDRHFLRNIATRIFEVHHNRVDTFDRTYDEYLLATNQTSNQTSR